MTIERDQDTLVIRRGGVDLYGWTGVEVTTAIDEAVSSFSVTVSGVYANEASADLRDDDEVEVWIGDDRVITGVVDEVDLGGDGASLTASVTGRSKAREAVDCSAPAGVWSGLRLDALARKLLAPYRLDLVDEAVVGAEIVRSHRTADGETVFDALDRLSRDLSFLVTDDAAGRVVLTRGGKGGRVFHPVRRGNEDVLSGSVRRSCAERFSDYLVAGQSFSDLDVNANVQGGARDVGVSRYRQLTIKPERGLSPKGAAARARWEASTRAAKVLSAEYTLRGWRPYDGALWRKNTLVRVWDTHGRLDGVELLVVGVTFRDSAQEGKTTSLRLAPLAAFEPPPKADVTITTGDYDAPPSTDPFDDERDE